MGMHVMENFRGLIIFIPCIIRSLNHIHQEMLTTGLERVRNPVACIFGQCCCCEQVLTLQERTAWSSGNTADKHAL